MQTESVTTTSEPLLECEGFEWSEGDLKLVYATRLIRFAVARGELRRDQLRLCAEFFGAKFMQRPGDHLRAVWPSVERYVELLSPWTQTLGFETSTDWAVIDRPTLTRFPWFFWRFDHLEAALATYITWEPGGLPPALSERLHSGGGTSIEGGLFGPESGITAIEQRLDTRVE